MKYFAALILFCFIARNGFTQVVTVSPAFPTADDSVTITFDATQGNGALKDIPPPIYMHSGVVTDGPTSTTWSYVIGNWGKDDGVGKMISIGNNKYQLTYKIRDYYHVPANVTVYRLAFVFRNANGSIKGANTDGSDIFYDIAWDTTLQGKFVTPLSSPLFTNLGDAVPALFTCSKPATISLYKNDTLVQQTFDADSSSYTFTANQYGNTWIKAIAVSGTEQLADSFYYVVSPILSVLPLPAGIDDGINYLDDSTATLVLVAPNKKFAYLIGDFSNWQVNDSTYMHMTPDSTRWWITLRHLVPLKEYTYQYLVDGNLYVADPYCDKILDPFNDPYITPFTYPNLIPYPTGKTGGNVSVLETGQVPYSWQTIGYVRPNKNNLVIYELLVRDFVAAHDYQVLRDTLHYLKELGVNAIELMPISEFEGNISWGYNPDFYFAPDKYYGPKDSLKAFIDACHAQGIAVIQDIVLNHSCNQSPMCQLYWDGVNNRPAEDNPWYNPIPKHDFNVCNDFNHESLYTKKFVKDVLKYWATEYNMDGWRFDLAKGFTQTNTLGNTDAWGQYDQSRVNIWEDYYNYIRSVDTGLYTILEYFADNSEEKVLANDGMMIWGNMADNYEQSAMGYADRNDFSWISYKNRGYNNANVVGYMESHDQERVTYKVKTFGNSTSSYNVKPLDSALNRMKLAAAFFIPIPGPKMIWQFGELGYDYSINYCSNGTINDACRVDPKPIRWDYLQYGPRKWVYKFYAALNELKENYPVFLTTNFTLNVGSLLKSIHLTDPSLNVCILGNFDVKTGGVNPQFQQTGRWYEYFTGDSIDVTNATETITLLPGEYRFYTSKRLALPDLGNVGIDDPAQTHSLWLNQNAPNPFSDFSTIDFYLPHAGVAKLEIFDLSGRLMKVITNRNYAPGYYTVDLTADDFENGIYFCTLTSHGEKKTTKMVVEK